MYINCKGCDRDKWIQPGEERELEWIPEIRSWVDVTEFCTSCGEELIDGLKSQFRTMTAVFNTNLRKIYFDDDVIRNLIKETL